MQRRVDPGRRSRRTRRTSTSPSTSPKARSTPSPASSWRARLFGREEELQDADPAASRATSIRARSWPRATKRIRRPLGQFRLRLRQRQRQPGDQPREAAKSPSRFFVDPGKRAYVRRMNIVRQHQHARRSDPPRVPPVRGVLVRRRTRSSCRATASTASATSRKSTSRRRKCRARPTRWTSTSTVVEKPTGNFMIGGAVLAGREIDASRPRSQQANCVRQRQHRRRGASIPASYNRTIAFSQTNPYFTDDGMSRALRQLYLRTSRPPALNIGDVHRASDRARNMTLRRAVLGNRHGVFRRRRRAHQVETDRQQLADAVPAVT